MTFQDENVVTLWGRACWKGTRQTATAQGLLGGDGKGTEK
jgi:hypothetical protein